VRSLGWLLLKYLIWSLNSLRLQKGSWTSYEEGVWSRSMGSSAKELGPGVKCLKIWTNFGPPGLIFFEGKVCHRIGTLFISISRHRNHIHYINRGWKDSAAAFLPRWIFFKGGVRRKERLSAERAYTPRGLLRRLQYLVPFCKIVSNGIGSCFYDSRTRCKFVNCTSAIEKNKRFKNSFILISQDKNIHLYFFGRKGVWKWEIYVSYRVELFEKGSDYIAKNKWLQWKISFSPYQYHPCKME